MIFSLKSPRNPVVAAPITILSEADFLLKFKGYIYASIAELLGLKTSILFSSDFC